MLPISKHVGVIADIKARGGDKVNSVQCEFPGDFKKSSICKCSDYTKYLKNFSSFITKSSVHCIYSHVFSQHAVNNNKNLDFLNRNFFCTLDTMKQLCYTL